MAEKAVKAAQAKAKELGTPMSVSEVDESGRLVLCARGDGASFSATDTSRAKVVAAAAFRRSTKEMNEWRESAPQFWGNVAHVFMEQALPSIGAVLIARDGRVIGAIGCGGGTGKQDHECAAVGDAALQS
jgi:uncharacterized protein GlcG (DUF336 family)